MHAQGIKLMLASLQKKVESSYVVLLTFISSLVDAVTDDHSD